MITKLPTGHYGTIARHCSTCGEFKQPEDFHVLRHESSKHGYQVYRTCKECEKTRKLDSHLKVKYGISLDIFNSMSAEQGHVCFLCKRPPSGKSERLVVDHNHKTGEVRKLLCVSCNVHLAKHEADPDYTKRIIAYLDNCNEAVK